MNQLKLSTNEFQNKTYVAFAFVFRIVFIFRDAVAVSVAVHFLLHFRLVISINPLTDDSELNRGCNHHHPKYFPIFFRFFNQFYFHLFSHALIAPSLLLLLLIQENKNFAKLIINKFQGFVVLHKMLCHKRKVEINRIIHTLCHNVCVNVFVRLSTE